MLVFGSTGDPRPHTRTCGCHPSTAPTRGVVTPSLRNRERVHRSEAEPAEGDRGSFSSFGIRWYAFLVGFTFAALKPHDWYPKRDRLDSWGTFLGKPEPARTRRRQPNRPSESGYENTTRLNPHETGTLSTPNVGRTQTTRRERAGNGFGIWPWFQLVNTTDRRSER
ncbi:hypothetical protein RHCRD62_40030 [Rhodococcus sp. RD6.2]|nr:hypothetical protein RHCRD62_40030 [Rhodococcus sp. RD6.2]